MVRIHYHYAVRIYEPALRIALSYWVTEVSSPEWGYLTCLYLKHQKWNATRTRLKDIDLNLTKAIVAVTVGATKAEEADKQPHPKPHG